MNFVIRRTPAFFLGCLALWLPSIVAAQTLATIKVQVPFEFKVGARMVPAGQYSVVRPLQGYPHYLQLRDNQGHVVASALTNPTEVASTTPRPKLTFYIQSGQHVLAAVWSADDRLGEQLAKTTVEQRNAARQQPAVPTALEGGQP